jgi:hypothetical protein
MTERSELNENKGNTREHMIEQMVNDTSRAFLDDVKPAGMQTKVEAESRWWMGLGKENQAPARLGSAQEAKTLAQTGWQVTENQGYRYITRDSADGKLRESDTYEKQSGIRLGQAFYRFDNKEALANNKFSQTVDAIFMNDGRSPLQVSISSGDYKTNNSTEFVARFNPNGTLARAEERGMQRDSTYYAFREDGSLYEALTRSRKDSSVVNDQLFNSKGQPRSDYNPLYLYEMMRRPVDNFYRGIRELRRSGGMF